MRISPKARVCSGLLCGFFLLILITGCSSPSSQNLASLTVTATPTTLSVGGAAVLKAVAHLSDGTTQDVTAATQWTSSNAAVASVSNGALTAKTAGTVTVQAAYVEAAPAGTSPASATVTPQTLNASAQVTITAAGTSNVPAIRWSAPAAITYGSALSSAQLNATANVAGTFAYTPAAGTVLKAGMQPLSVIFTPSDTKTYSAAIATTQITVNQATPVVTWAAPATIATGTALSAAQLNATANVPGSFMYNPAVGTVLSSGTQQLTAVFSPTDNTDYASATAHNSVIVGAPSSGPTPTPIPTPGPAPTPEPLPAPAGCGGPTINLSPSMSTSTLQSSISNAPNCAMIVFGAGTYNISSSLNIPCHSLTITGPVANPATAKITTSTGNISLFKMSGGCTSGTTSIEYLQLDSAGAFSTDGNSYSNINILHNQFTSIPSEYCGAGCNEPCVSCQSIYFNFNPGTTLQNLDIEYNNFGDANSCSASAGNVPFSVASDNFPGNCAGLIIASQNPGAVKNLTLQYNTFSHLEEGFHMLNVSFSSGAGTSFCDNCLIQYNYFTSIRRIQVEYQAQIANNPLRIRYNVLGPPDYSSANAGQYAFSLPCCQFGQTFGTETNTYVDASSNIIYDPSPLDASHGISWGFEAWGNGGRYDHNLIQGYVCVGIMWGFGDTEWTASYNTIQGDIMANGKPCPFNTSLKGNFIGQEFSGDLNANKPPKNQQWNTLGKSPTAVISAAPTISPASGAQSFPLKVKLTDSGYHVEPGHEKDQKGPRVPFANTGIWYTTDGSTPVPGKGTAQRLDDGGSFILPSAATVKAVGMWGAANQPTSYPRGYGFVPSEIKSATYTSGGTSQPRRPT
jgi:hypothetical protein